MSIYVASMHSWCVGGGVLRKWACRGLGRVPEVEILAQYLTQTALGLEAAMVSARMWMDNAFNA